MDEILKQLKKAGRTAFRTREYAALLGKKNYARLVLHRLKKKNEITSIKNGWWAFPETIPEAVASEVSKPCYISFHSALFLHDLTTQTPRKVQVAVARKPKSYIVFGIEAKEYKIKAKYFNNFYRKDGILLASPEKAFADSITLPKTCPDIILMEAVGNVDVSKVESLIDTAVGKRRLRRLVKNARSQRIG